MTQETRYKVLPHRRHDHSEGYGTPGTGDAFTIRHIGEVLTETKPGGARVFNGRPETGLAVPTGGTAYFPLDVLEKVESPQWSDVEKGDTVTVRLIATGEEFVTTAYEEPTRPEAPAHILGRGTSSYFIQTRFELLSIEKPVPYLPTTPGSVVFKLTPQAERANNGRGFPVFLLDTNNPGPWITPEGYKWSDNDLREQYDSGFEVIYDAGEKNE